MKRLIVVAAGTIALMSGAAYAGDGGCTYSKHLASQDAKTPVMSAVDELEADRIKKLKSIEEHAYLEALIETPAIHN